jgi:hypothetical protein
MHSVLMNIIQPAKIRSLVSQPRFPEVMPHRSIRHLVCAVNPDCHSGMQFAKNRRKTLGRFLGWRMRDEVIMIRKNRPRFEMPIRFAEQFHHTALKNIQTFGIREEMLFEISSSGNKVRPCGGKLMRRSVGPARWVHGATLTGRAPNGKRRQAARTPKAGASSIDLGDMSLCGLWNAAGKAVASRTRSKNLARFGEWSC